MRDSVVISRDSADGGARVPQLATFRGGFLIDSVGGHVGNSPRGSPSAARMAAGSWDGERRLRRLGTACQKTHSTSPLAQCGILPTVSPRRASLRGRNWRMGVGITKNSGYPSRAANSMSPHPIEGNSTHLETSRRN